MANELKKMTESLEEMVAPRMTSQHFRFFAGCVRDLDAPEDTKDWLAQRFIGWLAQSNPEFDEERFLSAAGIGGRAPQKKGDLRQGLSRGKNVEKDDNPPFLMKPKTPTIKREEEPEPEPDMAEESKAPRSVKSIMESWFE